MRAEGLDNLRVEGPEVVLLQAPAAPGAENRRTSGDSSAQMHLGSWGWGASATEALHVTPNPRRSAWEFPF